MMSKIKNLIIFVVIGGALTAGYLLFFNKNTDEAGLVSAPGVVDNNTNTAEVSSVGKDFLPILLNVKSIKLDDSIFKDPAFAQLHDSSIELVQDGNAGRNNPFAPIGSDITASPINAVLPITTPPANTSGGTPQ